MNIINNTTFNMHNSLLNNDDKYIKVTLKSKLIGVASLLLQILNLHMAYKTQENFKI